ncbi:hypothetical protein D8B26_005042 [Coccidioides posadasii str. Silveira]|uniref:uncharacterized protein n=1 Tax=Coccidioides posadasii (strain RMSCC 757 / Silveira) TaxID=443226 RepID=UPI001BEE610B|nr:hypothetical protein D8B26_005042 [Coccidioides posadasii str. Silveira]
MEQFLSWLDSIARMDGLDRVPQPELLAHYIKLARDVKHNYLELLNAAFSTDTIRCPKWIPIIFKLGQYGIAPRAFIQLAIEFPGLFNPMIVNAIAAPAKVPLQRSDVSLGLALQRLVGENQSRYVSCLTQVWGGTDPEAHFRHQCPDALAIHAEMQLVGFYDLRVERTPSFWFIGDNKVYLRYKKLIAELTHALEGAARQELQHRLGSSWRKLPADSSCGVSLSGLTEPDSIQDMSGALIGSQTNLMHLPLQGTDLAVHECELTGELGLMCAPSRASYYGQSTMASDLIDVDVPPQSE